MQQNSSTLEAALAMALQEGSGTGATSGRGGAMSSSHATAATANDAASTLAQQLVAGRQLLSSSAPANSLAPADTTDRTGRLGQSSTGAYMNTVPPIAAQMPNQAATTNQATARGGAGSSAATAPFQGGIRASGSSARAVSTGRPASIFTGGGAISASPSAMVAPNVAGSPGVQLSGRGGRVESWSGTTHRPLIGQASLGPSESGPRSTAAPGLPLRGSRQSSRRTSRASKQAQQQQQQRQARGASQTASRAPAHADVGTRTPRSTAGAAGSSTGAKPMTGAPSSSSSTSSTARHPPAQGPDQHAHAGLATASTMHSTQFRLTAPQLASPAGQTGMQGQFGLQPLASSASLPPGPAREALKQLEASEIERQRKEDRRKRMQQVAAKHMEKARPTAVGPAGVLAMHLSKRLVKRQKDSESQAAQRAIDRLRQMEQDGFGLQQVLRKLVESGCMDAASRVCVQLGVRKSETRKIEREAVDAARSASAGSDGAKLDAADAAGDTKPASGEKGSSSSSSSQQGQSPESSEAYRAAYIKAARQRIEQLLSDEAADAVMDKEPPILPELPEGAQEVAPTWLAGASVLPLKHILVLVARMAQAAVAALPQEPTADADNGSRAETSD